jgi:hypothetical protein
MISDFLGAENPRFLSRFLPLFALSFFKASSLQKAGSFKKRMPLLSGLSDNFLFSESIFKKLETIKNLFFMSVLL